jgi:hypothetical protein
MGRINRELAYRVGVAKRSGRRESNPHDELGRLVEPYARSADRISGRPMIAKRSSGATEDLALASSLLERIALEGSLPIPFRSRGDPEASQEG